MQLVMLARNNAEQADDSVEEWRGFEVRRGRTRLEGSKQYIVQQNWQAGRGEPVKEAMARRYLRGGGEKL